MPTYRGLNAIAARLDCRSINTVYRLIIKEGLPAYQAYHRSRRQAPTWTINDDLIRVWLLGKAQQSRAKLIQRRAKNRLGKGVAPLSNQALHDLEIGQAQTSTTSEPDISQDSVEIHQPIDNIE